MANLDAVVAAPDDEAPRLAYADAVATSDPARAELIKLQITLARCRKGNLDPEQRGASYTREHQLIEQHGAEWAKDVRPLAPKYVFLRGFVEHVFLDAAKFLSSAPELYKKAPVLHLDLTGAKPACAQLLGSPHLDRIISLRLAGNGLGDAEAIAIASSSHLGKLEWLDLSGNQIGAAGLDALAASDRLPRLGYLGFADNQVADPTPAHGDEYDAETPGAIELVNKHGKREWLAARTRPQWPPPRDAVWPS